MSVARFGKQKKENELPEISTYAPGIYARSEELVQATRDLDRGRTTEEAVEEQRLADLRAFTCSKSMGPRHAHPPALGAGYAGDWAPRAHTGHGARL